MINFLNTDFDRDLEYAQPFTSNPQKVARTVNITSNSSMRDRSFAVPFAKMADKTKSKSKTIKLNDE